MIIVINVGKEAISRRRRRGASHLLVLIFITWLALERIHIENCKIGRYGLSRPSQRTEELRREELVRSPSSTRSPFGAAL